MNGINEKCSALYPRITIHDDYFFLTGKQTVVEGKVEKKFYI